MKCNKCKSVYALDIFVPHLFWKKIRPLKKGLGGFLCPKCIIEALEKSGVIVASLSNFLNKKDLDRLDDNG